ncbi:coiled-coil domain-containing protein mad1 [Orbilia ellipsospora]|uniref:Spindle assembly checkpoint component MAD1 n=1 Tax=Orbilia ellipsospora TaxID=2528407 RepID=A0AAV9XGR3_9PEZI
MMDDSGPNRSLPHQDMAQELSLSSSQILMDTENHITGASDSVETSYDTVLVELNALRYELATLKQERELENIGSHQEVYTLRKRVQEDGKALEQERSEKNFLFERHQILAAELETVRQEKINEKIELERLFRDAQGEANDFRERFHDLELEYSNIKRSAKREIDELKMQRHLIQEHANALQTERAAQEINIQQYQNKLREKEDELYLSRGHGCDLKAKPEDIETSKMLKRELTDLLNHIKSIETKNRKLESDNEELRSYSKNLLILEEEKKWLQAKVQALDGLREKISSLELQNAIMEEERASWMAFLQDDPDGIQFSSPAHLARVYVQTKIEKNSLLEKFGRPDTLMQRKVEEIETLATEKLALAQEIQSLKQRQQKDSKERQRLERQKELALKEANFLREQLKTYSTEETVMMLGNYDDKKSQRIEELEKILEAHKSEIHALTGQIHEREQGSVATNTQPIPPSIDSEKSNPRSLNQIDQVKDLQQELDSAQQNYKLALIEIKALERQLAAAETTSKMRILQLKDNPTTRHEVIKAATLQALRDENSALLAQLEGRPSGTKLIPLSTLERSRLDIKEMESLVAEKEKRMLRLKEMWSKKALEFRQAVYSLLGYEVDFQPNGRVKVTSMFHRPDLYGGIDTSIIFDGEQGTMKLCGGTNSQFAREIKNQLKFYVEERKEIPCFLAALTMEGYEKTTRAQH